MTKRRCLRRPEYTTFSWNATYDYVSSNPKGADIVSIVILPLDKFVTSLLPEYNPTNPLEYFSLLARLIPRPFGYDFSCKLVNIWLPISVPTRSFKIVIYRIALIYFARDFTHFLHLCVSGLGVVPFQ